MRKQIAVYGGSFNPPHLHHRAIAAELSRHFDEVIVYPCGPRADKPISNDVEPIHRATMVDLNFRGLPGVRVELADLEAGVFTRTHELDRRFTAEGDVWHVVGADLVRSEADGQGSPIQSLWQRGDQLWREARFAVIARPGYEIDPNELPPRHRLYELALSLSSSEVRQRLFQGLPLDGTLHPPVRAYLERHGLYRGLPALKQTRYPIAEPRIELCFDQRNAKAVELAHQVERFQGDDPELIVVIGGDGTLLHAVQNHWRRRIPFYGVNTGNLGFLLNQAFPWEQRERDLLLWHVPLLYVELEFDHGANNTAVAFNDAWVERATGQTAWIQVDVDGQTRVPKLIADGALIATPAGSTSYARAMGAAPLPLGTPALLLVGSNVLRPQFWRPVVLPLESQIELKSLDADKRPLQAYVDGRSQGLVRSLRARVSNVAGVELVFAPPHDPAAKLAAIQFPPSGEA